MKLKVIDFGGRLPERAHPNDAGADVFCRQKTVIPAGKSKKVPLGFGLEVPAGFMAIVINRTSTSTRHNIILDVPPVDCGYTGEVHALVHNCCGYDIQIDKDEKFGQMLVVPIATPDFELDFQETRGTGAFGSTDKKED